MPKRSDPLKIEWPKTSNSLKDQMPYLPYNSSHLFIFLSVYLFICLFQAASEKRKIWGRVILVLLFLFIIIIIILLLLLLLLS